MEDSDKTPPGFQVDRRLEERIPTRIAVRFNAPEDAARALRAFSVNVSTGGLAIRTSHAYPLGGPLQITLEVGDEELRLDSIVAWSRSGIVGVRFTNVKEPAAKRLQKLISSLKP
jgi:hypothetical protein